jgi:hypothetical protein
VEALTNNEPEWPRWLAQSAEASLSVDRVRVGNTQQRFGKAHQRDAFGRRQRVFMQEGVDTAFVEPLLPDRGDQAGGSLADAHTRSGRYVGSGKNRCDRIGFALPVRLADRGPARHHGRRGSGENDIHGRQNSLGNHAP